jgi:hypothetical protein
MGICKGDECVDVNMKDIKRMLGDELPIIGP